MPYSYLPSTDSGMLSWSANFSPRITNDPTELGLTAEEAAAYAAVQSDYAAKFTAATEPET
jgi:hypothetical protein